MFIDQSALLAYLGHKKYSQYHDIINKWMNSIFDNTSEFDFLVTSDFVILSVTETLFNDNQKYEDIIVFIDSILRSSSIKVVNISQETFNEGCRKLKTYHEILQLDFSLTDSTTLHLLHSSRINSILTVNPLIHRLEFLLTQFDFDPDIEMSEKRLYYDAKPDIFSENELKKNFIIKGNEIEPGEAIPLFDLELYGWRIDRLKSNNGKVREMKLINEKASSKLPKSITMLEHIKQLDISNNDLGNINLTLLKNISNLTSLELLDLSTNGFKEIPLVFEKLVSNGCNILI